MRGLQRVRPLHHHSLLHHHTQQHYLYCSSIASMHCSSVTLHRHAYYLVVPYANCKHHDLPILAILSTSPLHGPEYIYNYIYTPTPKLISSLSSHLSHLVSLLSLPTPARPATIDMPTPAPSVLNPWGLCGSMPGKGAAGSELGVQVQAGPLVPHNPIP